MLLRHRYDRREIRPAVGWLIASPLAGLALIALSCAIFAWGAMQTVSHPQVRASGEPFTGPNWFGTYDWTEHDRALVEEMERKRIQDALVERRAR